MNGITSRLVRIPEREIVMAQAFPDVESPWQDYIKHIPFYTILEQ
jgi:hypothetical protein